MKHILKKELQKAFEAPAPTRKGEFLKTIPQPEISNLSFMLSQIEYIPKYVWGLFGLLFGTALVGGCFREKDVLWIVSALIPFAALSVLTGNVRSDIHRMTELEMSARFSFKSVILARMGILGASHLLLLIFLIPICAVYNAASVLQTGLYLLVPYMLTTSVGLYAIRKTHRTDSMYICMGIAIAISGFSIFIQNTFPGVYGMKYTPIWLIVLIILMISTIKEMVKNIMQTEELTWSLS